MARLRRQSSSGSDSAVVLNPVRRGGYSDPLVARGIHAEELGVTAEHHRLGDVADWLGQQAVHPDAVIERLVW